MVVTVHDVTTRARHQAVAVRRLGLTPIQLGMLFEGPMQGRPAVNLQQIVCWMPGEALDLGVFTEAWRFVQARHEALRTSFAWQGLDEPEQTVWSEAEVVLDEIDWRGRSDTELDRLLTVWRARRGQVGHDVTAAPTIRLDVFHTGSTEPDGPPSTVWMWTTHHLVIDVRTLRLVYEELFAVYERLLAGRPPVFDPAPQFHQHAAAVAMQDLGAAEQYVRTRFAGFSEPVQLGVGSPASVDENGAGSGLDDQPVAGVAIRVIDPETLERLEARVSSVGATVGTALMAAWAVVLGRCSRSDDVVFGSTRAGRHTIPRAADVVGCLINTVPLRADVRSDSTVDELLGSLREQQVAVRPFEHMPLAEVQRWSDVPNGTPMFTTDVVFERTRLQDELRALGGAWSTRTVVSYGDVALGLMCRAFVADGLEVHVDFDQRRFHTADMERTADHVARVLVQIADSDAHTVLGQLELLDEVDRAELLDARNPDPEPLDQTLASAFEHVAAERHDHVAVVSMATSESLTYGELDARANRAAHRLQALGVVPDSIVAVFLPRSTAFVEAVLATAKAGGAWLPMDPTYPAEALAHMLDDSGALVVLTTRELADRLPTTAATVLCVDDPVEAGLVAASPTTAPARPALRPDHLAYVIYTSGSTGRPKGVMIEQHQLVAYLRTVAEIYGFGPDERLLQFSALSFDTSVEELWSPLLCGGTSVLRDDATASSVSAYLDTLVRQRITAAGTPTAFWHLLVQQLDERHGTFPEHVRLFIVGGEKASRRALDAFRRLAPHCTFVNGYGPTEATIACTFWRLDPGEPFERGREVPIGAPAATARAYVLDQHRRPLPLGVAGELWIGGPLVARGYLNRPELTADRFRPDPFTTRPGARMYRTGDLARWLPDGTLEYLGRIDRQVKFRGYRIEPREVEAVLERHPAVAGAVAGVVGDGADARMVAWVTGVGDERPGPTELRDHCRTLLPAPLVPAAFVVLDRFPETPGGKVDVSALPKPSVDEVGVHGRRPAGGRLDDPFGAAIQDCFTAVLKVPDVGPDDSFFDLGGHSLTAMRLIELIDRTTGRRLTLGDLHQAPTPRRLAESVRGPGERAGYEHLIPIQPDGDRPPLFGVHVLGPNADWYRPLARRLGDRQPVLGLWIADPDVTEQVSIESIASRYADEVERWAPTGPVGLAGISLGGYVAFELAQQLRARGREIAVLALFDTAGPDGRPQLRGLARVRRHLELFGRGGWRHVRDRIEANAASTRTRRRARRAEQLQRAGGDVPAELWLARFVELNDAAARSYVVTPAPGRLTVFRATRLDFDLPEAVDDALGWARYALDGAEVVDVAGDHMSILGEPHVAVVAERLGELLSIAAGEPPAGPGGPAERSRRAPDT